MNLKKVGFKGFRSSMSSKDFYLNVKYQAPTPRGKSWILHTDKNSKNKFVNSWQSQQNPINLHLWGIEGAV